MVDELTPRARVLLDAVEREAEARRRRLAAAADAGGPDAADRPDVRVDAVLLAALELGVAGLERSEVADRLRAEQGVAPDKLLDAVFGTGSPPRTRLRRATGG